MSWEKPGNNNHNQDPWDKNNHNNSNKKKSKNIYEYGPPDIDDIFRTILRKFKKISNNNQNKSKNKNYYILYVIITVLIVFISSGFYTIKEAERGIVLRFGKFDHIVEPGLNWKPIFVDTVVTVNVESVRELAASGIMLTADENVVCVEMNVQYRVTNPKLYLFSVIDADNSLRQATDSALRGVIGKYTMDRILTEGRTLVRNDTQRVIEETIYPYNMGITLLDVNFQAARPPEEVKASFDDAIAARENEQQYIREAEAYANEVQPRANGQAQRILEEGRAYKTSTILEAQGEVQRFNKIIPEYKLAPEITRARLYIATMERILSNTTKILVNKNNNNCIVLPLNQILNSKSIQDNDFSRTSNINHNKSVIDNQLNNNLTDEKSINDKRYINIKRNDTTRDKRN